MGSWQKKKLVQNLHKLLTMEKPINIIQDKNYQSDFVNTTRILNFFVETRVVTYSESLILQGFPLFYVQPMHIRKHQNFKDVFIRQHHYMNTVFRYSYLDMLLQTLAVFCISAFDGGELHCKNGYIHPHSFESAAQKYIHAGRPPLF